MYIDVAVFENILMNYIILILTAKILNLKYKNYKLFFSSVVGAVYFILMLLPNLGFLQKFSTKIVLSVFLVIIAYTPSKLKQFFRILITFYVISFAFGGAAIALFYLTDANTLRNSGIYYSVMGAVFACICIINTIKYLQSKLNKSKLNVKIIITVDGKSIQLNALIDTGNSLYDPLSKWPVIIAEYDKLKELLPDELSYVYQKGTDNDLNSVVAALNDSSWIAKIRIIPFMSVGKDNGILLGFKPDQIIIEEPKRIELNKIIVGIYNKKLSNNHEYSALLHPDLF